MSYLDHDGTQTLHHIPFHDYRVQPDTFRLRLHTKICSLKWQFYRNPLEVHLKPVDVAVAKKASRFCYVCVKHQTRPDFAGCAHVIWTESYYFVVLYSSRYILYVYAQVVGTNSYLTLYDILVTYLVVLVVFHFMFLRIFFWLLARMFFFNLQFKLIIQFVTRRGTGTKVRLLRPQVRFPFHSFLRSGKMVKRRWIPPLYTQCLHNLAESWERKRINGNVLNTRFSSFESPGEIFINTLDFSVFPSEASKFLYW